MADHELVRIEGAWWRGYRYVCSCDTWPAGGSAVAMVTRAGAAQRWQRHAEAARTLHRLFTPPPPWKPETIGVSHLTPRPEPYVPPSNVQILTIAIDSSDAAHLRQALAHASTTAKRNASSGMAKDPATWARRADRFTAYRRQVLDQTHDS